MKQNLKRITAAIVSFVLVLGMVFGELPIFIQQAKAAVQEDEKYKDQIDSLINVTFGSSKYTNGPADSYPAGVNRVQIIREREDVTGKQYVVNGAPTQGSSGGEFYATNYTDYVAANSHGNGWLYVLGALNGRIGVTVDANDAATSSGLFYTLSNGVNQFTTTSGLISYCLQGGLGAPDGQGGSAYYDPSTGATDVSTKGKTTASRVVINGYPINKDYWTSKGIPEEAQRYATQVAIWCCMEQLGEPGNEKTADSWHPFIFGSTLKNPTVNGKEVDVLGMVKALYACGMNGTNVFDSPKATINTGGITIENGQYVATYTVSSTGNSGFVFKPSRVTGVTSVTLNGTKMTANSSGWYTSSTNSGTIKVTFPVTNTGSIMMNAVPLDTREEASTWAIGLNATSNDGTARETQDMMVVKSNAVGVEGADPGQASQAIPSVTLTVTKQDKVTGAVAQGDASLVRAVYGLYDATGTKVSQATIGNDHKATFTGLLPATQYYIQEISASNGYNLDPTQYSLKVDSTAGMTNNVIPAALTVYETVITQPISLLKIDKETRTPVEGAGFTMYLSSEVLAANNRSEYPLNAEGKIDLTGFTMPTAKTGELFTNANGEVVSPALPYGEYLVVETTAPGNYIAAAPYLIKVGADQITSTDVAVGSTVEEERFTATLKLVKMDQNGVQIPQSNIQFKLYDANGALIVMQKEIEGGEPIEVSVFSTGEDGTVLLPETLECGTYFIEEVLAPIGYIGTDDLIKIEIKKLSIDVTEGQESYAAVIDTAWDSESDTHSWTGNITIENKPIVVSVTKTDMVEGEGANELEGATLTIVVREDIYNNDGTIWKEAGEVVDTWVSTKDPHVIEALPAGEYTLIEETAPFGYSVAEPADFTVLETTEIQPVVMADAPSLGTLVIEKYELDVDATLGDETEGEDATGEGTEGEGSVEEDLTGLTGGVPNTDKPIAGTEFTLYYAEDVYDAQGVLVYGKDTVAVDAYGSPIVLTTDENGYAKYSGIPIGTYNADGSWNLYINYYIMETAHSNGYVPSDEKVPVVFEWDDNDENVVEENVFTNQAQTGRIGVVKVGNMLAGFTAVDTDFGKLYSTGYELQPLPGVVFGIYDTEECVNLIGTVTTDEEGIAYSEYLPLGTYYVQEISAPIGYAIDDTVFEITLTGDATGNTHIVDVTNNIANHPCGVTINVYKEGLVAVLNGKKYEEAKIPLAEVVFGIYNEEDILDWTGEEVILEKGSLVGVMKTNAEGIASLYDTLPAGKYYYKELATAEGFAIDTEKYPFTVEVENETNKEIDVNKDNPLVNVAATGKINIKKVNEAGEALAGVEFEITNKTTGDTYKITTDENGMGSVEDLPIGYINEEGDWIAYEYTLLETKALDGYIKDNTEYSFTFVQDENGQSVVEITTELVNRPVSVAPVLGLTSNKLIGFGMIVFAAMAATILLISYKRKMAR